MEIPLNSFKTNKSKSPVIMVVAFAAKPVASITASS
jgi:hypothetical protein